MLWRIVSELSLVFLLSVNEGIGDVESVSGKHVCPTEESGCCYGYYKKENSSVCEACPLGFFGVECSDPCLNGTCGEKCSQTCKCDFEKEYCDKANCCVNRETDAACEKGGWCSTNQGRSDWENTDADFLIATQKNHGSEQKESARLKFYFYLVFGITSAFFLLSFTIVMGRLQKRSRSNSKRLRNLTSSTSEGTATTELNVYDEISTLEHIPRSSISNNATKICSFLKKGSSSKCQTREEIKETLSRKTLIQNVKLETKVEQSQRGADDQQKEITMNDVDNAYEEPHTNVYYELENKTGSQVESKTDISLTDSTTKDDTLSRNDTVPEVNVHKCEKVTLCTGDQESMCPQEETPTNDVDNDYIDPQTSVYYEFENKTGSDVESKSEISSDNSTTNDDTLSCNDTGPEVNVHKSEKVTLCTVEEESMCPKGVICMSSVNEYYKLEAFLQTDQNETSKIGSETSRKTMAEQSVYCDIYLDRDSRDEGDDGFQIETQTDMRGEQKDHTKCIVMNTTTQLRNPVSVYNEIQDIGATTDGTRNPYQSELKPSQETEKSGISEVKDEVSIVSAGFIKIIEYTNPIDAVSARENIENNEVVLNNPYTYTEVL